VRTLVVSDLHLGARARPAVLTRPEPLRRLVSRLDEVDRLVLLGDVLEGGSRRSRGGSRRSLGVAEPVLREIGRAMGSGRCVVFVPGNHDRPLIRRWIRERGDALGTDDAVPTDASPVLAQVTSWLAPAEVRVHYPGVWLSDRVWATHGHYLDQHLLPESAFGLWRGRLAPPAGDRAAPADYERRPSRTAATARIGGLLPGPLAAMGEGVAELVRASTMPLAPRRVLDPRMARLTSLLLGLQMRRASIPAMGRVAQRLGIDADWILFGHVHRLGPVAGEDGDQWQTSEGGPRLANSGSWVYEPLLVHRATPPHPYWPGGAIVVEDERDPVAAGLLDDLPASALK
jgi:UDP-2,3-diacylglucosamine pyrophosphatase LpxH